MTRRRRRRTFWLTFIPRVSRETLRSIRLLAEKYECSPQTLVEWWLEECARRSSGRRKP